MTPLERILARIVISDTGCWVFPVRGSSLYGQIGIDGGTVRTHRLVYEELVGPIPDGYHVDHLCRVKRCCNPDHLEPVTTAENTRRGGLARQAEIQAERDLKRGIEWDYCSHCGKPISLTLAGVFRIHRPDGLIICPGSRQSTLPTPE